MGQGICLHHSVTGYMPMSWRKMLSLWRQSCTQEEMRELDSLDERELEDRFYRSLEFGTAGMRGVIALGPNRMNTYTVMRATAGLADYLALNGSKADGIVISYDSRLYSELFALKAAQVLAAKGIKAYLFDRMRPVPLLSFAIRHLKAAGGIMITASHNPWQYNGYKVYGHDGAQLEPERAEKVTQYIEGHDYFNIPAMPEGEAKDKGLIVTVGSELDDAYHARINKLRLNSGSAKGCKVVYTPLHGTGRLPVMRALEELSADVLLVEPQAQPDPYFSTVKVPNPEQSEALSLAIELALQQGASLVIATDPDADRLGAAVRTNGKFEILTGNQIGCLLMDYILRMKRDSGTLPANGAVIKTIVSSVLPDAIAADYGVELVEVLTGFKYIGEKIRQYEQTGERTYLFGFEESYGYLAGTHCRDKDAVSAAMLLTEMAAYYGQKGITPAQALERLYAKYGYFAERTYSFAFEGKDGMAAMSGIMKRMRSYCMDSAVGLKVTQCRDYLSQIITFSDGSAEPTGLPQSDVLYYTLGADAWACVRPSGTEPKLKLYVGAKGRNMDAAVKKTEDIKEYFSDLLK